MKKRGKPSRSKRPPRDLEAQKNDATGGSVTAVNRALRPEGPPIRVLGPEGPPIRQYSATAGNVDTRSRTGQHGG